MKLRHLIACLFLLIGVASLAAVAYLTWRNVVHGDGMILWLYLILVLAGIPLAITWWKDLVATEWSVIVSFVLAASLLVTGFALYEGFMEHGNLWHAFAPEDPQPPFKTFEEFFKNKPPERPILPRIAITIFWIFLLPVIVPLTYKGSLFCLRRLSRRYAAPISQ
jgi:hypothetical protein